MAGPWAMDLGGLRLEKARQAFESRNPAQAIVEAEELLDTEPDNIEALMIVGNASLEMGDPATGRAAFIHVLDMDPDQVMAVTGLAVSCFEITDFEGCVSAADACSVLRPEMGEPWYYRGLALERLGRTDEALKSLRQAARLDPRGFPMQQRMPKEIWPEALGLGMQLLPPRLRRWYQGVHVVLEEFPQIALLRASQPPLSPAAGALYEGTPPQLGHPDPWTTHPERVILYTANLERGIAGANELPGVIAFALRQEALDWLGLQEDDPTE
jgi:tetratricopeptide (TPR) repeat protein